MLEYIDKNLNDTKATEKMTNEQYNNLLEEKEKISNERKDIQNKIDKVQKKIDALSRASSKCNLAWKSLFNDKSWDEIHVRAMNGRYTKKEMETTKQKEEANQEKENIQATTGETRIAKTSKFRNRFPRISKMFDFAKTGVKKVSELFKSKQIEENQNDTKQEAEKNHQRDAFIEELRRHVENDKSDKELEYIEKHKKRSKENEQEEEFEK